jgi:ABC-2 type transport system permease protein
LVVRQGPEGLVYVFDPQRSEAQLARAAVDEQLQRALGRTDAVTVRDEKVEAAGSRYIDWMVPGLVGVQLMGGSMWGIAFAIVEWRQKKLLKRLVATPMRRSDFLLSFVLWRLTFVLIEVTVLLLFAHLAFKVPIIGGLPAVFALCLLGAGSFAGVGLLAASRAKNTETANGLVNLVQLPMYLLSGVFFSASRFPEWAQAPIHLLPLTALNDALRGVINEGLALPSLWGPIAVMAVWGILSGGIALRIFKWV